MVSMAPAATSTASVRPATIPVGRAIRRTLDIGPVLPGHGEGHDDARAAALAGRYLHLAAQLHGQPPGQGQTEAAVDSRARRTAPDVPAVVLDDQFHLVVVSF